MTTNSIEAELKKLRAAVAGLEAQRAALGDEIVAPAIESLCDKIAVLEAQVAAVRAPAEERRVITILFTDVVGSTSLAEKLDPEEWREIVARLHTAVGDIIGRHHGQVAQYLGDGLLALFGAQDSNESDPENAIRAALDAQVEVGGGELEDGDRKLDVGGASSTLHARYAGSPTSNLQPPASNLQIRIGIHSGLVVVGDLGSEVKREFTATGDAMNLAARLQSAAPPGGVLISHDTYRHVRGIFDVAEQPPLTLKGKSQPIQTYLVRRVRPRPFRTVTRGVAGIDSHTVGREAELTLLQAAFETALAEHKTMWAQIVGQPGMGKSRLLSDMTEYLAMHPDDIGVLRARAFQGDEKQAFGLIRRMWFDRFQIAEDTPLAEAEAKWEGKFLKLRGPGFEEAAHALGLLTGLPFMDSPHIGAMRHDPAQVKGRAMVVSRELLASLRERAHIVLLLEDLHWADASSWEYLTQVMLAAEAGAHGVFVLATARPEWNPPAALLKHAGYVQIHLAALPDSASRELVSELLSAVEGDRKSTRLNSSHLA